MTTFDATGIGDNEIPFEVEPGPGRGAELLARWHEATGQIGLDAVDHRGWQRFVVVTDSWGRRPQSASRGGAGTRCSASRWDMPPCLTRPRRARRSAPVRSALRAQSRQSENGGAAGAPRRV